MDTRQRDLADMLREIRRNPLTISDDIATLLLMASAEVAAYRDHEGRKSGIGEIVDQVAEQHGITVKSLKSKSRMAHIVAARHAAMYRIAAEKNVKLARIAWAVGCVDHTTAIHGIQAHAERYGLPVPDRSRI